MAKSRNFYKYYFKVGDEIKHIGITDDLNHTEKEHQVKSPNGYIFQVGLRATEEAARKWEKKPEIGTRRQRKNKKQ